MADKQPDRADSQKDEESGPNFTSSYLVLKKASSSLALLDDLKPMLSEFVEYTIDDGKANAFILNHRERFCEAVLQAGELQLDLFMIRRIQTRMDKCGFNHTYDWGKLGLATFPLWLTTYMSCS
jgi:hypothetical protein